MSEEKFHRSIVVTDHELRHYFQSSQSDARIILKNPLFYSSTSARFRVCLQSVLLLLNEGEGPVGMENRH